MVAAYALLLTSALAPAEVDAAGLARVLATQSGGQAVVALADGRSVAIDESGSVDSIAADLKKRSVRFIPGPVGIAHSEILPDAAMPTVARLRKQDPARKSKPVQLPADALKAGKLTFTSEAGTYVDLQMLPKLGWSQPLVLSPAFANTLTGFEIGMSVKDLDESEFLRSLAKAIGGRFRTDGKSLRIEASGGELRARAIRGIELAGKNPRDGGENAMNLAPVQEEGEDGEVPSQPMPARPQRRQRGGPPAKPATMAAQLDVARVVTNSVAPQDFERFLDGELESVIFDLAGQSAAQNALLRLLRADATEPASAARLNRLLATVPPRAPGSIVLGNGYSIDATLNTIDRRGNPSRTVRLKVL